ncbi:MAG: flagellar hook-associated protein FlgL [Nevskiales bacterium]|nr:flagellar hook-associated protein FlgL [Nevskiales bacterium]
MRISTAQMFRQGIEQMQRQQFALARTQQQISTGLRWTSAADDPANWAAAEGLQNLVDQNAQYQSNAEAAMHRLYIEEDALASGIDVLNRVRELVIQGNTASQSDESRAAISQELDSLREQLLTVANRDDGQGRYIFAGSSDSAEPFSWDGSAAIYGGDQQVREAQIGTRRTIAESDAGSDVFMRLKTGNGSFAVSADAANAGSVQLSSAKTYDAGLWDGGTYSVSFTGSDYEVRDAGNTVIQTGPYTSGAAIRFQGVELSLEGTPAAGDRFTVGPSQPQDAMALVDKLARLLEAPQDTPAQKAQVQTAMHQGLTELDDAQLHFSSVRAGVGLRLRAADDAVAQLGAQQLHAEEALSNLRDVDVAEAISNLQQQMLTLQAAQQTYMSVQGLSLFDYLR